MPAALPPTYLSSTLSTTSSPSSPSVFSSQKEKGETKRERNFSNSRPTIIPSTMVLRFFSAFRFFESEVVEDDFSIVIFIRRKE
uniref:Uncharacterized protein n=1 Tax=Chenopodium quinoa TaxID=63459 RepID=A0A803LR71_CHEQI